jgi:hypothetical protein
LRSRVRSDE